jgi:hypothetical protein
MEREAWDLDDLSDHPEVAFLQLVGLYIENLDANLGQRTYLQSYRNCVEFVANVQAAAEACGLSILGGWDPTNFKTDNSFNMEFLRFRAEVEKEINVLRIRYAQRNRQGGVRLTNEEKATLSIILAGCKEGKDL